MGQEEPTAFQKQVAAALEIDISSDSSSVAAARIHALIVPALLEGEEARPATERQVAFAQSLGLWVGNESALVASAKIAEELFVRNKAAIERMQLQPGDHVRVRRRFEYNGKEHELVNDYVISSIQPDCRIWFKGGNGLGAWPTQVERLEEQPVA